MDNSTNEISKESEKTSQSASNDIASENNTEGLSKNQMKKLRKKKHFQEMRPLKRKRERERRKERRKEMKLAGTLPQKVRCKTMDYAEASKISVAIDLDFPEFMVESDQRKVVKQVKLCYTNNRKAVHPLQFYITSFTGIMKDIFVCVQPGCVNWDVYFKEEDYYNIFDHRNIVYLTAESENVLETLDESKTYVIGGLVDHNQQKGLCHQRALQRKINHAQLPISQYIKLSSRKVLTINHVFEILVKYTETRNWEQAFYDVIPKRKGVHSLDSIELTKNISSGKDVFDNASDNENIS